jgi:hypothetical protein
MSQVELHDVVQAGGVGSRPEHVIARCDELVERPRCPGLDRRVATDLERRRLERDRLGRLAEVGGRIEHMLSGRRPERIIVPRASGSGSFHSATYCSARLVGSSLWSSPALSRPVKLSTVSLDVCMCSILGLRQR